MSRFSKTFSNVIAGTALVAFLISTEGWDPHNDFTRTGARLLVALSFGSLLVMAERAT